MTSTAAQDYNRIRSVVIRYWVWLPILVVLAWFGWMIGTPSARELRDRELSQKATEASNERFNSVTRGR